MTMKTFRFKLVDYADDVLRVGCITLIPTSERPFPIAYDENNRRLGKVRRIWPLIEVNRFGGKVLNFPANTPAEICDSVKALLSIPGLSLSNYASAWDMGNLPETDGHHCASIPRRHIAHFEVQLADDEKFDLAKLSLPTLYSFGSNIVSNSRFAIYDGRWLHPF